MNARQIVDKLRNELEQVTLRLYSLPLDVDFIDFASNIGIFMKRADTVEEFAHQMDHFANLIVERYYISSGNIAVSFIYNEEVEMTFFCKDVQGVIDLFGWDCKVKTERTTGTHSYIVCNLEEE